jgi:uncharacterized protein YcbK (DUF882 family)
MLNKQVSESFHLREFACSCCGLYAPLRVELVLALQELRDLVGKPIHINSGVRCASHNTAVGGSKKSQHLEGRAVDIVVGGMSPKELANYAKQVHSFQNGGIGVYEDKGFVHVDVRGKLARW